MVYEIVLKKRFKNKLEKLFEYLEHEFGFLVAKRFAEILDKQLIFSPKILLSANPQIYFQMLEVLLQVKTGFITELKSKR
jgi:hypothetical protein